MAYGVPSLSPYEAQNFGLQRANARRNLLSGRARTGYEKSVAGLDYTTNQQRLTEQYNQRRTTLPTDYIQRGVFRSGIYNQGLQDYGQERLNAFGDLGRAYQKQLGGLTFDERELEDVYATALANISGQEFARRAQTAASLRNVL